MDSVKTIVCQSPLYQGLRKVGEERNKAQFCILTSDNLHNGE